MKHFSPIKLISLLFVLCMLITNSYAQKKKANKKDAPKTEASKADKEAPKKISELTKKSKKIEGLFTFYQDTTSGALKMVISQHQLEKEFIYFSQISDGVLEAGAFRGSYRGSKVFKLKKYFNKIEFVSQNTSFYFDPNNEISKSSQANISESILASLKIEGIDSINGLYLIDADHLFLKETFSQIKPAKHPKSSPTDFSLGNLDKEKTKVLGVRSYPKNTDLAIEYVYSTESVLNGGSQAVTDGRNVSIKVYHSLIEMPENNYQPLFDDPRVGYFTTQVNDMTSTSSTPYRDFVHRWNLVKKEPNASISEPIEPIVWWMENSTPKELRPIIKAAGEKWNLAFEKAGFKNAIVIKQQPDDADWDAGDIRYNVLRWTSSPQPPFGGYGPSFVNPRTGQILGADIMLEYISLTNNLRTESIFNFGLTEANEIHIEKEEHSCQIGQFSQFNNMFASIMINVLDEPEMEKSKMINEFLHYLVLHEMGHTLGLNHNMKASQLHPIKDIHNTSITEKMGLIGSVMDYPSVNISNNRLKQGNYYSKTPGPYDDWAIQFAYQQGRTAKESEDLLAKSTLPELTFGNDADDMRSPGKAIDPRVNVGDLTSDAIGYAIQRIELAQELTNKILSKNLTNTGESHHFIRTSYMVLLGQQNASAATISRYIGGVYVDRAMIGQQGGKQPFIPVELAKQKQAMHSLNKYIFAPDAFSQSSEIYNYLQMQRRGFGFFSAPEDPKIHTLILAIQTNVLNHLLHHNTLQRIVDSELYGNKYTISIMMTDLNNAIFAADIAENVNSFRQNLQVAYTKMLIEMLSETSSKKYLAVSQSLVIYNLNSIKKMASNQLGDVSSKAHKSHLVMLIENAMKKIK